MRNKIFLCRISMINALHGKKYGRNSDYSIFSLIDESDDLENNSYFGILTDLLSNKIYVFTMLGISCLLFIITGIQFWISDYMMIVLKVDPKKVFITFALVCITAPVFGVMSGGYLIQRLGGYTSKHALETCFKISIIAAVSGMFLPLVNNAYIFVIMMWLLLFFGGSIVPGLTGIMISSTHEKTKEVSNSITHLCYNLLGYLPSPFLYGLVCKYTGGQTSRWGLAFILLWSYFGVMFLYFAKVFKERKLALEKPFDLDQKDNSTEPESYDRTKSTEEEANAIASMFGRMSLTK
jgi:predicted MFS family arabinose efflux permease